MKNKLFLLLRFLIGWPLSIVALFFIIKLIQPQMGTLLSSITQVHLVLFFSGILSFLLFYFLRSYIWHRLIKNLDHDIPLRNSCYMWSISELKRYIPGNIWSFLGRTMLFAERGVKKKDIAKSLIIEAELFILGCAIVSILALPFLVQGFTFYSLLGISLISIILLGILFFVFFQKVALKNSKILSNFVLRISNFILPPYPPSENFFLVLLSTIAALFFGLGNYLIIGSVLPLHPQLILELTGFFAFSLLAGYLSLLTPAGFGVREGIVIYGLSKIMSFGPAAFAALFSRIMLIFTELIFILIVFAWHKIGTLAAVRVSNAEKWVASNTHLLIVLLLSTTYTVYFTAASFLRYDNFYTGRFDLGNMAQTVWNTTQGRIFLFTNPNGTEIVSRLAFHADFILIFLAPFYAVWANPKMLLLIQVIVVAAGAFIVYLIANHILKNKNISLAFAFAYLINPGVERANLYDFHAVVLATTLLLATYYFYLKKNYWYFGLFALLAALCKEQIWLIIALFGALVFIRQKQRIFGASIFLVSIGMFYFLIWHAIPNALGSQHFALSYYSDFGDGPSGIVKSILFSPDKTLHVVLQPDRIDYLRQIFSPLGYISLLSPFLLIFAVPDLIINLLSNNDQLHQIYYQYTATISPFLFITAMWGVWLIINIANQEAGIKNHEFTKRMVSLIPNSLFIIQKRLWAAQDSKPLINIIIISYIALSALIGAYKFGPLPGSKGPNIDMFITPVEDRTFIDNYLANIPKNYRITATNNVGSHLSQREYIYTVPLGLDRADIVVFLLTDPWTLKTDQAWVAKLKKDSKYQLIEERGKFVVFRRKS